MEKGKSRIQAGQQVQVLAGGQIPASGLKAQSQWPTWRGCLKRGGPGIDLSPGEDRDWGVWRDIKRGEFFAAEFLEKPENPSGLVCCETGPGSGRCARAVATGWNLESCRRRVGPPPGDRLSGDRLPGDWLSGESRLGELPRGRRGLGFSAEVESDLPPRFPESPRRSLRGCDVRRVGDARKGDA